MITLSKISTGAPPKLDKDKIKKEVEKLAKKIAKLQHVLYVQKKYSLLVILQGMDASGKDGAVKNVFADCNPSGLDIFSFKKPTEEEFAHDFLWRCHKVAPRKGNIMIFVRSHYEDILIQRVHKWIDEDRVAKRMAAINSFEELLQFDNNTTVLKFYLHISPEVQLEKLQERIDLPEKQWKHNPGDWEERKLWSEYMRCYEYAINHSSVPWHVTPADKRWYRNYFVATKVLEALEKLPLTLPSIAPDAIPAEAKKPKPQKSHDKPKDKGKNESKKKLKKSSKKASKAITKGVEKQDRTPTKLASLRKRILSEKEITEKKASQNLTTTSKKLVKKASSAIKKNSNKSKPKTASKVVQKSSTAKTRSTGIDRKSNNSSLKKNIRKST